MGTAIEHPVPDRLSRHLFLTSGHSGAQSWASECPDAKITQSQPALVICWQELCSQWLLTAIDITV